MHVLVTGACGYKGAVLVPRLLALGHTVTALDVMWFGNHLASHANLSVIEGDIRALHDLDLRDIDAVIHLAAVADDPTGALAPGLTWEISALATMQLAERAARAGVGQFIYASSASVYGIRDEAEVTEGVDLMPRSQHNTEKMCAERILLSYAGDMVVQIVRVASVCGVSPRMRFDTTVNHLAMAALETGRMTVEGGQQITPTIHLDDICNLYVFLLDRPDLAGIYNAGFENKSLLDIAQAVKEFMPAEIDITPSRDPRSCRLNSDKLFATGFIPEKTVRDAIGEIVAAHQGGWLRNETRWHNVAWMTAHGLA